jgi:hypothetical protein
MATFTVPYIEAGQAAFEVLDTYLQNFLLSGDHPKLAAYPMTVKADEVIAQFTVVGLDANDLLVPALWHATPGSEIAAIGVITQAVTGAAENATTVPVFYSGHFNPDALIWPASFDTDAKKMAAFNGAASPTQIQLRTRQA